MRIVFKDTIIQNIARLIDEAHQYNKDIEAIYLAREEWDNLCNHLYGYSMNYGYLRPERVRIHEPFRIEWSDRIHCHTATRPCHETEQVEFMGVKLRREYK